VALSRHRDRISFHWTRDQFADWQAVTRTLGRARLKDTTLDYKTAIRQGIEEVIAANGKSGRANQTGVWAELYGRQRREAAALATMSAVRRAFWLAANLGRFAKAGVVTLAKLHERERRRLAADLQSARRNWSASRGRPDGPGVPRQTSAAERASSTRSTQPHPMPR
jgi:hypothetical protein